MDTTIPFDPDFDTPARSNFQSPTTQSQPWEALGSVWAFWLGFISTILIVGTAGFVVLLFSII